MERPRERRIFLRTGTWLRVVVRGRRELVCREKGGSRSHFACCASTKVVERGKGRGEKEIVWWWWGWGTVLGWYGCMAGCRCVPTHNNSYRDACSFRNCQLSFAFSEKAAENTRKLKQKPVKAFIFSSFSPSLLLLCSVQAEQHEMNMCYRNVGLLPPAWPARAQLKFPLSPQPPKHPPNGPCLPVPAVRRCRCFRRRQETTP